MSRLNGQNEQGNNCKKDDKNNNGNNGNNGNKICLTPSNAIVVAGILGGVLDVNSILVDREQTVQIILIGSLKRKTELEKMMDKIGSMPFDDVVKAFLDRL